MTVIQWSDELSVKIPSIDNQHKTLVKLINKLDAAIEAGNARQVLQVVLGELTRYAQAHFIYEEALFTLYHYPDSANHILSHEKLFEKVEQFKQALEDNEDIYAQLVAFLNDWLAHHILQEDMAYSVYLLQRGAE